MGADDVTILKTKLDILIGDFSRIRDTVENEINLIVKHNIEEDVVQADIQRTVKYHSIIGVFVISSLITFSIFLYTKVEEIHLDLIRESNRGAYYEDNRELIVEMIEAYKRGYLIEANTRRKGRYKHD